MDRKQPLLLIFAIVLFGVAIAGAIWVFGERNVRIRRDAMMADIRHLAADAYQYRLRPASMGGGGGSYRQYAIPAKLLSNALARYLIPPTYPPDTLRIEVTASQNLVTISAGVDPDGRVIIFLITGDLAE